MIRFRQKQRERQGRSGGGCHSQNCSGCKKSGSFTLDHLKPGETGIICSLDCEGALRRRLLDMGLTPNTAVMVRKVAPFGDPIELYLRNYELTIRKEDAARIRIREAEAGCGSSRPAAPSEEESKEEEQTGQAGQIGQTGEVTG